jgi:hypothetical protein
MSLRPLHMARHAAAALACSFIATAPASAGAGEAYVVGGATFSLAPNSGEWAWNGSYITDFRAALANPAYFGPAGIVQRSITTTNLASVSVESLSGLNMFVATWLADVDFTSAQVSAVTSFFLGGGDLFLLQDDDVHDVIGQALGLRTFNSTGSVSNGGAPLYNGPFGTATNVTQHYNVGRLDEAAVLALGGTVAGRNVDGQVTSAFWRAGEFAPGAGALFINADIDMVASTSLCGLPVCGATYSPLNSNGIFALNTFAFIQNAGGTPPIPEPGTYALFALGLAAVLTSVRRRQKG